MLDALQRHHPPATDNELQPEPLVCVDTYERRILRATDERLPCEEVRLGDRAFMGSDDNGMQQRQGKTP